MHEDIEQYIKNPKFQGSLENPTFVSTGTNRLCGDVVTLSIAFERDTMTSIRFQASGCVLSKAASALTTELCVGKSAQEVFEITDTQILDALGIDINLRKQCALLPLYTVKEGLHAFLSEGVKRSEHLLE